MGNKSKQGGSNRLGLVDLEAGPGMVYMTVSPPDGKPAEIQMQPGDARALADGLNEAARQAEEPEGSRGPEVT